MKKCHKLPARGSYKEAKAIQAKKRLKSFFDYSDKEKQEIIMRAVKSGSEMQQETIRQAKEITDAVDVLNKFSKLKFKCVG